MDLSGKVVLRWLGVAGLELHAGFTTLANFARAVHGVCPGLEILPPALFEPCDLTPWAGRHAGSTYDGLPVSSSPPFGCAIVVYRRAGQGFEYLVLHRGQKGPDYEGNWAWGPPAGARLPGEDIDECARRELQEEAGLDLPCVPVSGGSAEWPVYGAEAAQQDMVALSAEHDRFTWLPLEQAIAASQPALVGDEYLAVARRVGDPSAER